MILTWKILIFVGKDLWGILAWLGALTTMIISIPA